MKNKNDNFVKENICQYCTYPCDSAFRMEGKYKPSPGDISICMMCCCFSQWDENMCLIKFDINSIQNLVESREIKTIAIKIEEFWKQHPDQSGRREKYLKIMDDRRCK